MLAMVEKRPSFDVEAGLKKHLQKAVVDQPMDVSRSTARTSADKGKEMLELGEVLEWGYTMRELCEVEDRAGADRYFASIMTRLKCIEGEDPLVQRWSTISGSSPFWTKGPLSGEYLRGALHPTLAKDFTFLSVLIDRVHDVDRLVRSQQEKILALQAANKEPKASVGQKLAAVADRWAKELEAEIERMRTELESLRS
ncbi:hypothetical protein B296_00026759 [Ensete ventricosum]|uniref:Uncharacterized protein n=1 Tax=Ensete ventricosum TaxID=4639 RepID=A0A427A1D0_ENSVE|nr:hypothetical protein B296_00026759 [Ensete ventricosum]